MVANSSGSSELVITCTPKSDYIKDNKKQLCTTPRSIESLMKYFGGPSANEQVKKHQKMEVPKIPVISQDSPEPINVLCKQQSRVKELAQMFNGRIQQFESDQQKASTFPINKSRNKVKDTNSFSKELSRSESNQQIKHSQENIVLKLTPTISRYSQDKKIEDNKEIFKSSVKDKIQFFNQMINGVNSVKQHKFEEPKDINIMESNSPRTVKVLSRKFESCSFKPELGRSTSPSETSIIWTHRNISKVKTSTPTANSKEPEKVKDLNSRSIETSGTTLSSSNNSNVSSSTKIRRRSRAERNSPKMFFSNEHLERLFYAWVRDYDTTKSSKIHKVNEGQEIPEKDDEAAQTRVVEVRPKITEDEDSKSIQLNTGKSAMKVIKDEEIKISSSKKPKTKTDETSSYCKPENYMPEKPIRKKIMRRNMVWEKENSIIQKVAASSSESDKDLLVDPYIIPKKGSNTFEAEQKSDALESVEDQGFETGSNNSPLPIVNKGADGNLFSPLFVKIPTNQIQTNQKSKADVPSANSTPLKKNGISTDKTQRHSLCSPIQTSRRSSIYKSHSRRNSIKMNKINEHKVPNIESPDSIDDEVFHSSNRRFSSIDNRSSTAYCAKTKKSSTFWVSSGMFRISTDVFYNSPDRLRLLYDIFSQKVAEGLDLHFGIDDMKYSSTHYLSREQVSTALPRKRGCSHYWFSAGDLAVPFSGKQLSLDKIVHMFNFIRESESSRSSLRFGVDNIEFSKAPENTNTNYQKFSIESSYSMLIGLSGENNGLEECYKYDWPKGLSRSGNKTYRKFNESTFDFEEMGRLSYTTIDNNDFDFPALNSEDIMTPRNSTLSFSPEIFSAEYENEPLDQLFKDSNHQNKNNTVPQMVKIAQNPKQMKSVEEQVTSFTRPDYYKLHNTIDSDCEFPMNSSPEASRISCNF